MNTRTSVFRAIGLIGIALGLCGQPAHATLYMAGVPSAGYQTGIGALVRHGLTVQARTNLSRLIAGGSFEAWCVSEHTDRFRGERELSSALIAQTNVLFVTIPASLPAYQNMPGFESVERGRTIQCYFDWRAYAEEPKYVIGVLGTTVEVGGEKQRTDGRVSFTMDKPGISTGEDDACIP